MLRTLRAMALAVATMLMLVSGGLLAVAQAADQASEADATGVSVRANVLGISLLPETKIQTVRVPDPSASNPNDVSAALLGPIVNPPAIEELSVLRVSAKRTDDTAHAEAHSAHAFLIDNAGVPLIKVDALHSVADAKCVDGDVVSDGAANIVGLFINGQGMDIAAPPNTVIPVTTPDNSIGVKLILNEQVKDASGHGITVTALHLQAYFTPSNVLYADVKIAQAHASAYCVGLPGGGGDRGGTQPNDPVVIDKNVKSTTSDANGDSDGLATAYPGDNVTWKISFRNTSDLIGCQIIRVTDVLPPHFSLVSTSGDLTTGKESTTEGQAVTWDNPGGYALAPGATLTETLVAKVADDTPVGTYLNLVNVEESTCSAFSSGMVGPVKILAKPGPTKVLGKQISNTPAALLPSTGVSSASLALVAALLLGAGYGVRVLGKEA